MFSPNFFQDIRGLNGNIFSNTRGILFLMRNLLRDNFFEAKACYKI
jgi:hypothetical protein